MVNGDRELRFLELLHTGIDRGDVAMYEKGMKGAASVGRRAVGELIYMIRLGFNRSHT